MNAVVETLKTQLMTLPVQDRAELASFLLSSLDGEDEDDPAVVEAEWKAEIERRIKEMESGKDPGIPAEEVFAELRKKYR